MNHWKIVAASVRYYWRTHLGVALGSALGAMVLIGSLLVGDSVKETLRRQALQRVGKVDQAMIGGDRFFREALSEGVSGGAAPVLLLRGSAVRADGQGRINQTQVIGVDERFWALAPGKPPTVPEGEIGLNERAAAQLGVKLGDTLVIRMEKPSAFSRDAPLSGEESAVVAIRAKIGAVVSDFGFGRFSLQASQVPPFSIFIPLKMLQERLGMSGRANVLLAPKGSDDFRKQITQAWQIADAGLELRRLAKTGELELRTSRVFLDPPVIKAAPRGLDALTYLVNELRAGDKAAPYSMATAIDAAGSGFLPAELADDEIVITQWLADDLGIGLNDKLTIKYFVMGERRQLEERTREFMVLAILPMNEPQLDASWMPDFPGLSDAENCRDWEPGFALDESKIRDKDEAYWDTYRGTPKAFVNIMVGQEMWGNRWGNLSAIRYRSNVNEEAIAAELQKKLPPDQLGMSFVALREQALAATNAPVDFAQLFVGFSFFLIGAAAVLTGLLFVFSLEQRNQEAGLLLAVGWQPRQVRNLLLSEGIILALLGSIVGALGALLYTRVVLRALGTVWRGAVGSVEFVFAPQMLTVIGGIVGSVAVAASAMWLASRRQLRHSAGELLAAGGVLEMARADRVKGRSRSLVLGAVALVSGIGMALFSRGVPAVFFGAGALLLIAGLAFALAGLQRVSRSDAASAGLGQLGLRNAARRRGRSLATIGVLASGVFMVVAVDSFRQRPVDPSAPRSSGTGGFALVGQAALPIYEDLNTAAGREAYAIEESAMKGATVVPMRVREGDDASCLNLNRALQPQILGVKSEELSSRDAFRFASGLKGNEGEPAWAWLDAAPSGEAIPGIVDQATLQWALKMKLGDTLEYRDDRGQPFKVQLVATLAGSVLQGSVLISETEFIRRFPGQSGYRFLLIDAPATQVTAVQEQLSRALQDRGLELAPAARRLAEFQAVENTYLSIFQVLGGLGLLLGSAGLAIVVARNVLERRREFGLLEAVGFRRSQLRQLVFAEHRWLIAGGLLVGIGSALVAVWPGLQERAGGFPLQQTAWLVASLTMLCVFWAWLATRLALRGSAIAALRAE